MTDQALNILAFYAYYLREVLPGEKGIRPTDYLLSHGAEILVRYREACEKGIPANATPDGIPVSPLKDMFNGDQANELMIYLMLELISEKVGMSLVQTIVILHEAYVDYSENYREIRLEGTLAEMLDTLEYRKAIADMLKDSGINLDGKRVYDVIQDFMMQFRDKYATAYRFESDFGEFVRYTFQHSYLPANKHKILGAGKLEGVRSMNLL